MTTAFLIAMVDMKAVLFDLDGTLTDPHEGVIKCIHYALEELGRPIIPAEQLGWCIGPPFHQVFGRLFDSDVEKGIALYRKRYGERGMFENRLYPGIPAMLEELSAKGLRLFVASAKAQVFVEPIVAHFGLRTYFEKIYGSELDGTRTNKAELIAHLLDRENVDPGSAVMVGDRIFDVEGARKNGMKCIGVSYGHGSVDELQGATMICSSPHEVLARLKSFL